MIKDVRDRRANGQGLPERTEQDSPPVIAKREIVTRKRVANGFGSDHSISQCHADALAEDSISSRRIADQDHARHRERIERTAPADRIGFEFVSTQVEAWTGDFFWYLVFQGGT